MARRIYTIQELNFFKDGCEIDFLSSLKHYRCYKTEDNVFIAVIQVDEESDVSLSKVNIINRKGEKTRGVLREVPVRFGRKYLLFELVK